MCPVDIHDRYRIILVGIIRLYWLGIIIIQRTSETGGKGVKLSWHLTSNMSYAIDCNTQRIKYKLVILKLTEISNDDYSRCNRQ